MVTLVDKNLNKLVEKNSVFAVSGIEESQIQPSSIDLRLSDKAYVIPCSFLPIDSSVDEFLKKNCYEELDLFKGQVLYPGNVYIVPLIEGVKLDKDVYAHSNPKSSTGRIDLFVRMLADKVPHYDFLPAGFKGKLYAEIIPQSFPVKISKGIKLMQLRFFTTESKILDSQELRELCVEKGIVFDNKGFRMDSSKFIENNGVYLTVDVSEGIVGYKAKRSFEMLDLSKIGFHNETDFFEPVYARDGELILEKGSFYILSTKEHIAIPEGYSSEIVPIDTSLSDLRSHYAGFIDPGWGGQCGAPIVLEVRTSDHNFLIKDGQRMAKFEFVRNMDVPKKLYGMNGNNYNMQKKNKLSKFFKS